MFWTVIVEFQLYLIFPFLITFSNKRGNIYLFGILILAIIFRLLAYYGEYADPKGVSYGTVLGRIDQFLIGVLTARLYIRNGLGKISTNWFPIAGIGAFSLLAAYHHNHGSTYVGVWCNLWHTFEGVIWASCIVSYISFGKKVPELPSRILAYIGKISYSIYLLHFAIIFLVQRAIGIPNILQNRQLNSLLVSTILVLPITLILSSLTYSFIEKPFLQLRNKYVTS
jgi:hypothetical protein